MKDDFRAAEGQHSLATLITGRQSCTVTVPGTDSAKGLSVQRYRVREAIGEAYVIPITLTHANALDRADYVGRDATVTIDHGDGQAPRNYSGYILNFSKLKTTADFCSYKITVVSHIRRLDDGPSTRIFQRKSDPEIIESMLRARGFLGHQFEFRLRRKYPQNEFRFQYGISDWQYIRMLMEKCGIYCYTVESEFGDVVIFGDDIDHYIYQPELKVLYREMSGMTSDQLAVSELKTHISVVPQSFLVADYNPDKAWERYKADANVAQNDTTTSGQPYVFGTHHLDQEGARWEAQLRHEAAMAWQIVYEGKSNILELTPGRILRMDQALPDSPNGQLIVEVTHSGGRQRSYSNRYKAIPCDRRLRLPIREHTWPKIGGTLTARITSPGNYKYAYMTAQGRYPVRFDCDFATWNPGGESVALRLAKPFAGALQTGFHFPLIDGTEVGIAFIDGNPDKPYIAHAHHHSQATDLITNQDRWLSRNVIRTQSNNKIRMEDWEGEEHVKISTEHSGKSQLSLGHLVDNKRQKRGEGFELRTSGYGAIRAGKGLLISTDDRARAVGQQLDLQEAMTRLNDAQARMEGLVQAVKIARAEAADAKQMQEVLQNQMKDMQEAVMLLSAKSSIALVTPDTILHSAGTNLTMTAGASADIGVLRKFTVAAGEAVSLFAQKCGIKVFAGKGKVQIQAQSDEMELTSQQNMTITSSEGHVVLQASKSVTLSDGAGAYIKLENGSVTIGSPAKVAIKMANFQWSGPDSIKGNLPSFATCHGSQASAAAAGANSVALT